MASTDSCGYVRFRSKPRYQCGVVQKPAHHARLTDNNKCPSKCWSLRLDLDLPWCKALPQNSTPVEQRQNFSQRPPPPPRQCQEYLRTPGRVVWPSSLFLSGSFTMTLAALRRRIRAFGHEAVASRHGEGPFGEEVEEDMEMMMHDGPGKEHGRLEPGCRGPRGRSDAATTGRPGQATRPGRSGRGCSSLMPGGGVRKVARRRRAWGRERGGY